LLNLKEGYKGADSFAFKVASDCQAILIFIGLNIVEKLKFWVLEYRHSVWDRKIAKNYFAQFGATG
jgi:hypothetical protein